MRSQHPKIAGAVILCLANIGSTVVPRELALGLHLGYHPRHRWRRGVKLAASTAAMLAIAACSHPPSETQPSPLQFYRANVPGSPVCAGGQPQMQYNCPEAQH